LKPEKQGKEELTVQCGIRRFACLSSKVLSMPPVTLIGTAADKDISVLQQLSCSLASDQTLLLCFCVVSHVATPKEQQNQNQSCFAKGNSASPLCKPTFARVLKLCAFSFPSGIPCAVQSSQD